MQFSKSPLFTLNNIHYLCAETKEIQFLSDYQFEESDPDNISENLPTKIQNKIRELGDSYYSIAIIPHEKVSDFANKLKANLRHNLEHFLDQQITYNDLYNVIPDFFQNLAALQDIDQSIQLDDLLSLVTEIDKFSEESLSSQILF